MLHRFPHPAQERRYRVAFLERDARHLRAAILVMMPVILAFGVSDWLILEDRGELGVVLALRCGVVVVLGLLAAALGRVRRPEVFDRAVFACLVVGALGSLALEYTRPPTYLTHAVFDVAVVVIYYVVARIPLALQVVPALLVTGGELALFLTVKELDTPLSLNVLVVSLVMANGIGVLSSLELERSRRAQFALLERETDLRVRLEGALEEIDTLKGVLPICSGCKQIQDEEGAWHPVELFVRARSRADFTHGLCPTCARRYFPDIELPPGAPGGR